MEFVNCNEQNRKMKLFFRCCCCYLQQTCGNSTNFKKYIYSIIFNRVILSVQFSSYATDSDSIFISLYQRHSIEKRPGYTLKNTQSVRKFTQIIKLKWSNWNDTIENLLSLFTHIHSRSFDGCKPTATQISSTSLSSRIAQHRYKNYNILWIDHIKTIERK